MRRAKQIRFILGNIPGVNVRKTVPEVLISHQLNSGIVVYPSEVRRVDLFVALSVRTLPLLHVICSVICDNYNAPLLLSPARLYHITDELHY
jgi:hypothetical protein